MRVIHISAGARDLRIRPGQTLADAKALAPQLITFPDNPAADRRTLETLASRADRFSPIVHIESDDTLFLDVTGAAHLFGDEATMLARAVEGLGSQGFSTRGAVADTAGAAWAIAHAHPEPKFVSRSGRVVEDIVSLPVWSMRIDNKVVESLHRVGVDTVVSLLHLPRSSLAARFGDDVLTRIDQALGDVPEVLTPHRPQPVLFSEVPFGGATDRLDLVLEGVRRALEMLCEKLAQQVAGASEIFVTLTVCRERTAMVCGTGLQPVQEMPASAPTKGLFHNQQIWRDLPAPLRSRLRFEAAPNRITLPITLSQPTRSVKHLFSLARVALERERLPGPVENISAWTRDIEPLDDWQNELFNTDESDERELASLIDRLAVRLGSDTVVCPQPVEDHQPERAFRYASCTKGLQRRDADRARKENDRTTRPQSHPIANLRILDPLIPRSLDPFLVRPLRLLPEPVPLAVTALYPEGPPVSFSLRGRLHVIGECVGPERIETGWWRGPHIRRDYYRVVTREGARAWIFRNRDAGAWLLHGWFD